MDETKKSGDETGKSNSTAGSALGGAVAGAVAGTALGVPVVGTVIGADQRCQEAEGSKAEDSGDVRPKACVAIVSQKEGDAEEEVRANISSAILEENCCSSEGNQEKGASKKGNEEREANSENNSEEKLRRSK